MPANGTIYIKINRSNHKEHACQVRLHGVNPHLIRVGASEHQGEFYAFNVVATHPDEIGKEVLVHYAHEEHINLIIDSDVFCFVNQKQNCSFPKEKRHHPTILINHQWSEGGLPTGATLPDYSYAQWSVSDTFDVYLWRDEKRLSDKELTERGVEKCFYDGLWSYTKGRGAHYFNLN